MTHMKVNATLATVAMSTAVVAGPFRVRTLINGEQYSQHDISESELLGGYDVTLPEVSATALAFGVTVQVGIQRMTKTGENIKDEIMSNTLHYGDSQVSGKAEPAGKAVASNMVTLPKTITIAFVGEPQAEDKSNKTSDSFVIGGSQA